MNSSISKAERPGSWRQIPVNGKLREEIYNCWLFFENWDDPLPCLNERHVLSSASGRGGSILSPAVKEVSDYWVWEQFDWNIAIKEAAVIDKVLMAFQRELLLAVINAWNNQGGRSPKLTDVRKNLFLLIIRRG